MVRVLVAKPGQKPEVKEIDGNLREYQDLVGGYIQAFQLPDVDGVMAICDDEGKLKGLHPNFEILDTHGRVADIVVGPVVFVGDDGSEDFASLTDEQIKEVQDYLDREGY